MLKKDRVNLKRNSSIFFLGFMVVAIAGLMFFLSSSFFIDEKVAVMNTEIMSEKSVSGTGKVTINSWVYDESKGEMEVTIVTEDLKTIDNDIVFEVFQRNGNSQSLKVEKVFEEDGVFVLKIFGIDKEFQQVALDVIKESENKFSDVEENEKTRELISTLYSDQRKVKHENIEVKTEKEYTVFLSDVLIAEVDRQFSEANEQIRKEKEKQIKLENEIKSYEENMIYETAEEKMETESIINGLQMRIDESNEKIKENESRGLLLQDKKDKLEMRKLEIDINQ